MHGLRREQPPLRSALVHVPTMSSCSATLPWMGFSVSTVSSQMDLRPLPLPCRQQMPWARAVSFSGLAWRAAVVRASPPGRRFPCRLRQLWRSAESPAQTWDRAVCRGHARSLATPGKKCTQAGRWHPRPSRQRRKGAEGSGLRAQGSGLRAQGSGPRADTDVEFTNQLTSDALRLRHCAQGDHKMIDMMKVLSEWSHHLR
jgi:hypothetical protein